MPLIKDIVKDRYIRAAQMPDAELCCPTGYDLKALKEFVPKEVIDVSYGCGAPAGFASLHPGEAVLDIGCGGGIDCFEVARLVGPEGKVVGIDMTEDMLLIARRNAPLVMQNLGYASPVVEFRKGEAEDLPVENSSFDLVISNCVINLSPKKEDVFEEIFRVLRPGGRFTISDIVSDQTVPQYLKLDGEKWGACLSGGLHVSDYFKIIHKAGFIGLRQLKFNVWKRIDGINFYSVTVSAQKPLAPVAEKASYRFAIFRGPFSKVKDERGNVFQRGQCKKISQETSQLLNLECYRPYFILTNESCDMESIEKQLMYVLPEGKKCIWEGDYAVLSSLFLTAEDDDHHAFYMGQPLEICDRTKKVLTHDYYRDFFAILNRAEIEPSKKEVSCSPDGSCC